jgi:hypothetical protein
MRRRPRISPSARAPSWLWKRDRAGRLSAFRTGPWKPPFERYQEERRLEVCACSLRRATRLEWFEEVERYLDLDPVQFNYSLLTRSQRISHENLRLRDPNGWFGRALVPEAQAGASPMRLCARRCSRLSNCVRWS